MADRDAAFDELVKHIDNTPWMNPEQGRLIWDHVHTYGTQRALDVGTCYGTSAAYLAGAMKSNGGGRVITVDSSLFDDNPDFDVRAQCKALWERCGVTDMIDMVRIPCSNYAWWLMTEAEAQRQPDGTCSPGFDFAYLDGAKWFTLDAASVVLIEALLRPGGWLLMDDLDWRFVDYPDLIPDVVLRNGTTYPLSEHEIEVPHLRAVFDTIVTQHPNFTRFIDQGNWGWAQKGRVGDQRIIVKQAWTLPPGVSRTQWVKRRLQAMWRGRSAR